MADALDRAEQVVLSPYKAIAGPKLMKNWAGTPKLESAPHFTWDNSNTSPAASCNSMDEGVSSSDPRQPQPFIIRHNSGSFNKGTPRQVALSNSRSDNGSPRNTRANSLASNCS